MFLRSMVMLRVVDMADSISSQRELWFCCEYHVRSHDVNLGVTILDDRLPLSLGIRKEAVLLRSGKCVSKQHAPRDHERHEKNG